MVVTKSYLLFRIKVIIEKFRILSNKLKDSTSDDFSKKHKLSLNNELDRTYEYITHFISPNEDHFDECKEIAVKNGCDSIVRTDEGGIAVTYKGNKFVSKDTVPYKLTAWIHNTNLKNERTIERNQNKRLIEIPVDSLKKVNEVLLRELNDYRSIPIIGQFMKKIERELEFRSKDYDNPLKEVKPERKGFLYNLLH